MPRVLNEPLAIKSNRCLVNDVSKLWQRGYYDRIVRNERELNAIREYIRLNPERWAEDRDNLDVVLSRMIYHG